MGSFIYFPAFRVLCRFILISIVTQFIWKKMKRLLKQDKKNSKESYGSGRKENLLGEMPKLAFISEKKMGVGKFFEFSDTQFGKLEYV